VESCLHPSNTLLPMLNFLWPLTPPILISEGSCSKNQETIGSHLDSFLANSQTQNHIIQSTFDCELLAAQAAIKHLHHFCKGRAFQLWTNHKPLVAAISHVSAPISPRQQRHLAFLSQNSMYSLWTPAYTPTDHLTSWVYSTTFVQYMYISCYLSDNKPVLFRVVAELR
jgi:hypothetical protein